MSNFKKIILIIFFAIFALEAKNENEISYFDAGGSLQFDDVEWIDNNDDYDSGRKLNNIKIHARAKNQYSETLFAVGIEYTMAGFKLEELFGKIKKYGFTVKFGKLNLKTGLEDITNTVDRTFMQTVLVKGEGKEKRYYGIEINFKNNFINFTASCFEELKALGPKGRKSYKPESYYGRVFINPVFDNLIQHYGLSFKIINRNVHEKSTIFELAPFISPNHLLVTLEESLPRTMVLGFEVLSISEAMCFQAEGQFIQAQWKDYHPEDYVTAYAQISIIVTGEPHEYDFNNGVLINPTPKRSFGAFEIYGRIDFMDIYGRGPLMKYTAGSDGQRKGFTIGFTWYVSKHAKVQINYTKCWYNQRVYSDSKISGIGVRMQFEF